MNTLIAGIGEIGKALEKVLKPYYQVECVDREPNVYLEKNFQPEILHICFPFSETFIEEVQKYQNKYKPKFTVIHSTCPVGTSRQLNAVHSPCRGLHPNLESGLLTFPKFLGGSESSLVADYFRRAGMKVILCDKQETTEAMKLFDTEYYRVCIEFAHRVKRYCDAHDLNFHETYTIPNQTYNSGYTELGHPEFVRPVLQAIMTETIGGHCVGNNQKLIQLSENPVEGDTL